MGKLRLKNIIFGVICLCLLFITVNVYASTKTYERTEDNLQVNSRIKVTSTNKKAILNTPKVDEIEKIYDFANLFTNSQEKYLYDSAKEFIDSYNLDMVIVTINNNNKKSTQAYADDFYDYNYFGKNTTCDGILFLIDMDNRKMWISTTGQAIRIFDDARINSILDDAYNYISSSKYYECANAFINSSSKYAAKGVAPSNQNTTIDENGDYVQVPQKRTISWLVVIGISGLITLVIVLILASKHKTIKKATSAKTYIVNNSFSLTAKLDKFLTTHTTSRYTPRDTGGSSGGSSTHSGSSGISHGGGGRSF